jgi:hypothetical protein
MNRNLFGFLLAVCGFAQAEGRLDGVWMGTLSKGDNTVHIVCSFEKPNQKIISVALRVTENDIESVTIQGVTVRFSVPRVKGGFEGKLIENRKQLQGVWIQPGLRLPLTLTYAEHGSIRQFEGIEAFVPKAPTVVRADAKDWLFYELYITNSTAVEATLLRVELLIGEEVVPIEGEGLKKVAQAAGTKLAPGVRSVVLINAAGDQFPDLVRHRVTYQLADASQPTTVECAPTRVERGAIEIGSPVAGGPWRIGSGPDTNLHHRAATLAYKGRTTISQRFAFDLFLTAPGGKNPLDNRDHPTFGEPLYAVADAKVVAVLDRLLDNVPYDIFPASLLSEDPSIYGNHVVLDLGRNHYATYAHMQPGIRVKPGDRVRRGDLLGLIGDSGASGAPHLHFQITDGPDPIASEGVPFVFSFTRNGVAVVREMPLNDWTVTFPERK